MRPFASLVSKNARSVRRRSAPRPIRLQMETLEDRRCPAALVAGGFVLGSSILDVTDFAGSHGNLTISGDSGSGGPTSMITVSSGADAITFTPAASGALDAINVAFPDGGDHSLSLQGLNLANTAVNVTGGDGNDTVTVGTPDNVAGSPPIVLNSFTWKTSNVNGTTTQSVSIYNAIIAQVTVQENSGTNDVIRLWGVSGNSFTSLSQGNGSGGTISIDELGSISPPAPSVLGQVTTSQGGGSADTTTVSHSTLRGFFHGTQGNGDHDSFIVGDGVVGNYGTPPPGMPGTQNITVVQGTGDGDYIGVGNLIAGVVTLIQQDQAGNPDGDVVGGPIAGRPTTTNNLWPGILVPSDGFANAFLQQLNITQGSAPGDIVAICQLQQGDPNASPPIPQATASESLTVTGGGFFPGVPAVPGTITILQQDIAGNSGDLILLGSYIGPYYAPAYTGSITAMNEVITQGDAYGDFLNVLFNKMTSPTTQLSSLFVQGNGGDAAFFQEDTAVWGGLFNYSGGSGGNYVQADSNSAIGTFDGGPMVAYNVLGQDNNNMGILFVDFGNVIFA